MKIYFLQNSKTYKWLKIWSKAEKPSEDTFDSLPPPNPTTQKEGIKQRLIVLVDFSIPGRGDI